MKSIRKIMLLGLVMLLTSCMKMDMNVDVSRTGHISSSNTLLISETLLAKLRISQEDFMTQIKTNTYNAKTQETVTYTELSETYEGVKYVGLKIENSDTLGATVTKAKNKYVLEIPLTAITDTLQTYHIDRASLMKQGYTKEKLAAAGVTLSIVINMPETPTANIGTVEGKKVTIDLLELIMSDTALPDEVFVTCPIPSSSSPLVAILLGGVVLVCIAYVQYAKKRKTT